ncbi:MAG: lysophospholipid acyltransferase family protein [Acidimicrobiales bacterium]
MAGRLRFPYSAPEWPAGLQRPAKPARTGTAFDTSFARRPPARIARAAMFDAAIRPALRILAHPRAAGLDRLTNLSAPAIFAANHQSHLDMPLLLASLPERFARNAVVGAAADYFFGTRLQGLVSAIVLGAIPIERERLNRTSTDLAAELLDGGHSLIIFPEGGRSPDGWGQPWRGGAAYLSLRCNVPVVPVNIDGTRQLWPKGARLPSRGHATITFGLPLRPGSGETTRRFAARLELEAAATADEAATSPYAARLRRYAGTTPSQTGPEAPSWRRSFERSRPAAR